MLEHPKDCEGCPLDKIGQGFSNPEGNGSIPLLIVGESLGYNEMLEGLPFRPSAQAGSILHRIIQEKTKHTRSEFAFWNLCACHPPSDRLANTSYEYEAINHCRVYFDRVVAKYKPKVILACGVLPFKHLTGLGGKRGDKLDIGNVRGYVFRSSRYPDCLVVPTYHPSYIRRGNSNLMGLSTLDFDKATKIAQGKYTSYSLDPINDPSLNYILTPSTSQMIDFYQQCKSNPSLLISLDIENSKSAEVDESERGMEDRTITQIQFSISSSTGMAFKWNDSTIPIIKMILSLPNPKVNHNLFDYDYPVLRRNGIEVQGELFDTLLMAHHYQPDLPLGLQPVASWFGWKFPWKHLSGKNFKFYGVADADSALTIYYHLRKALEDRGLWGEFNHERERYTGYYGLVQGLRPILVKVQARGLPINQVKQDEFRRELEKRKGEIEEELRGLIPKSFIRYFPTKGYVREPKELIGVVQRFLIENSRLATEEEIEIEAKKVGFTRRFFNLSPKESGSTSVERWCKEEYFNPSSSDQVSDYIKYSENEVLAKKLAVNIAKETRNKEEKEEGAKDNLSTSKGVLKGLALKTANKVYSLIVEYREIVKMSGTFLWKPLEDGRVHTRFGFRTGSGQLTSRDYNIQQGPQHYTLAEKFKETIEAGEGKILIKVDYRGFHNRMMGFLAEDIGYYKLASYDTHSYVTGHVVKYPNIDSCLSLSDIDLIYFLKTIKKEYEALRDDQIKHCVHGINFGLSEKGCYERYRENFNPSQEIVLETWGTRKKKSPLEINQKTGVTFLQEEVEKQGKLKVKNLYSLLRELFPKIFKYQERILVEASTKGYIDTSFGHRRWFPAASEPTYDRFGNVLSIKKGEQAEEALAYPVSNNAHCFLREGVIIADREGILDRLGMVNWVHDDLRFEAKVEGFEEDLRKLLTILERKSMILRNSLGRFSCKADIKIGKSLATLEEYKI